MLFVVEGDLRRSYGQLMCEKVMGRACGGLQKLQLQVEKGQLQKAEEIGAAVRNAL